MKPLSRRTFVKGVAVASAAATGPLPVRHQEAGVRLGSSNLQRPSWTRAPCRLCGVGCGLLIGVEGGRVVAVKGDPDSPVAQGLGCVKGYHAAQALYGRDRLTRALVRRNGVLVPTSLGEALDVVAERLRQTITEHGKDSVGVYGSGQWTIPDAYVAAKLFKGGLGTNNVDGSSRLHAGSGSAGLIATFGLDGAPGSYEDIDHADTIILWDINLAESDPVIFSRMLDRRRRSPAVRIIELATRTTRTSYGVDRSILFAPHAALAIANGIGAELVAQNRVRRDFVERHVTFQRGRTDFDEPSQGQLVPDDPADANWEEYRAFLGDYGAERVQELSGVPAATLRWLATLYGDPARRVMSVWGGNVNADVRGTWANNALYNVHLLVGKLGSPGNAALAITGQPNGAAAVHDAGARADGLPGGLVTSAEDRRRTAELWRVPQDRIDPKPGLPALAMFGALERGDLRFLWIQATNPMLSLPNLDRHRRAAGSSDRFVVVNEAYPTPTTDVADVVLPAALWIEREGIYGNVERRLQYFARAVAPPGDAASDAWHMVEVGRRIGLGDLLPWDRATHTTQIWEEYRQFHSEPATALPPIDALREQPGVLWPYVDSRETTWRYAQAHDPAADAAGAEFHFYGHEDGRARIWLRPFQPAAEPPDDRYPFWLVTGQVLEHWGGGAMTRRIPSLNRGLPHGYVEIHREDAAAYRIRDREIVRLVSRRGAIEAEARIDYRSQPPRGQLFVPRFDESMPVHRLTGDRACPLSGQPDGIKCAVRIERVNGSSAR